MKDYIYLLCFLCISTATACRNKSPKPQPLAPAEQLPPYTETGANTFGCLIDGEVFVPKKNLLSLEVVLQCTYQYVSGNRFFNLAAHDFINNRSLAFNCKNIPISENIYQLGNWYSPEDFGCKYGTSSPTNEYLLFPLNQNGELHIKHFDTIKQIVSGTFLFDAIDTSTNKITHVTEGRFDVRFTR